MITVFTTKSQRSLNLCFSVRGSLRSVKFVSPVLFGNVGEATFTTLDDELATVMKKSPMYGVYYHLKSERELPKSSAPAKVKTIEEELKDPDTAIRNESVTTKQMAIAFIQGSFSETFSAPNLSVEEMKREAARRWNVLFVKWGN